MVNIYILVIITAKIFDIALYFTKNEAAILVKITLDATFSSVLFTVGFGEQFHGKNKNKNKNGL